MDGILIAHYRAPIHKGPDSCYGVSFPDVPGARTPPTRKSSDLKGPPSARLAEDRTELSGEPLLRPRMIDELRADPEFLDDTAGAVVAAISLGAARRSGGMKAIRR